MTHTAPSGASNCPGTGTNLKPQLMNVFKQHKGTTALIVLGGVMYLSLIGLGQWVQANNSPRPNGAPSPEQIASSRKFEVQRNIRERCERRWDTNYRMIRYCIDRQTEAARSLGY
jgi:hypothetical protein